MVRIGLPAGAVAHLRFAVSCLWEVVAAVRVLRDPGRHAVHLPWANRVGPRVRTDSLLWRLIPREPAPLPDFLTPLPPGLTPDLDAELAVLRATTADEARGVDLDRLSADIAEFWRVAIAPDWPAVRLLLDAEVFARARRLAEDGAAGLLNDLHERVRWEGDTLSITKRYCTADDVPDGRGLVLVPSVFVWPAVLGVFTGVPQLAFPARGVATLWESRAADPGSLGALLGRGRAQLLLAAGVPSSTTELARRTGMTAGAVSQHLRVLRAAGLVVASRRGRSVLTVRTALAEALLSGSVAMT